MKYSLSLILLAASLTACNSGGICNPDTASKAHAKTPPASGNPLVESGAAQNNNPTAPILSAPAANESHNTPSLNPVIVTNPVESVIANHPSMVNSYQYPDSCVPVKSVATPLGSNYMYAKCKNDQGIIPDGYTNLNLDLCAHGSAILNNNGLLVCAQYRDDIPKGSYLLHCRVDAFKLYAAYNDSSIKISELSASCHDKSGNIISTEIAYSARCSHGTVSLDEKGNLVCDN